MAACTSQREQGLPLTKSICASLFRAQTLGADTMACTLPAPLTSEPTSSISKALYSSMRANSKPDTFVIGAKGTGRTINKKT
jgi:hypothetical protein